MKPLTIFGLVDSHAGLVRAREAQPLVHPSVRWFLRPGIGVRFSPGRLALRTRGSHLGACGSSALANSCLPCELIRREPLNTSLATSHARYSLTLYFAGT
jgi:hypothetical protein